MRRTLSPLLLLSLLLSNRSFGQVHLEPFGGYQLDMNNAKTKLINSGVQFAFGRKKYQFLIQLQRSWPQRAHYNDSSFSLNPGLPLYAMAGKIMQSSAVSFALGNRFKIAGWHSKNSYYIKLYTGITDQKINYSYQYDKNNYTLLNPQTSQEHTGIYISGGFEYMHAFNNNNFFVELNVSSPPSGGSRGPNSYNLVAPLSLNVGYSIHISKK